MFKFKTYSFGDFFDVQYSHVSRTFDTLFQRDDHAHIHVVRAREAGKILISCAEIVHVRVARARRKCLNTVSRLSRVKEMICFAKLVFQIVFDFFSVKKKECH